jgi:hypothetical protein
MSTNIREILAERRHTHGNFDDHATITQQLKRTMTNHGGWMNLSHAQREALEMIAHKIGRILAGNPCLADHWADIGGYAQLVADLCPRDPPPEAA